MRLKSLALLMYVDKIRVLPKYLEFSCGLSTLIVAASETDCAVKPPKAGEPFMKVEHR